MPPENEVVTAAPVASDPVVTATPVTEVVAPVVAETPKETPPESKTFTQEELDAAVGKRLARERRAWERDQQSRAEEQARLTSKVADEPRPEQFESAVEYAEKLAMFRADRIIQEREDRNRQSSTEAEYNVREEDTRTKYIDYDQIVHNPQLRITSTMAETIKSSEVGPEVAYFLGTNPKEADRIAKLHPLAQAREIGRIEAKLIADPPSAKKASSAPAPITPIAARSAPSGNYDTTDPRSIDAMSTSDWIAADRRRQLKKQEALAR